MSPTELTISGLHQSHHNKNTWSFVVVELEFQTYRFSTRYAGHTCKYTFGGCGGGL